MDADLRCVLEQHHVACFGWALACCRRDRAEAQDVLQTSYLKILEGRARFDGRSNVKTWLFGVIRRTAAEERRRRLFRLRIHSQHAAKQDPECDHATSDATHEALSSATLVAALASLAARQREVLHLVFYQGLTVEDAARVMGVSVGTARTHYDTCMIATLMLLGAASALRAQPPVAPREPDAPCKLILDDTAGTRVRSVKLPSGQYNTFSGGRVLAHCANQPAVQMRADSVEYYGEQGLLYLIGHVSYTAPRAVIDTHDATHFEQTERVPKSDPLATYLFPPELIMAHQRELALQDSQQTKIISEIEKAQSQFVGLQWTLSAAQERLQMLLASAAANEAQVLAQVDRTLAAERDIKRLQVTLLVRIKNTLTATQQANLNELRNASSSTRIRLGNVF